MRFKVRSRNSLALITSVALLLSRNVCAQGLPKITADRSEIIGKLTNYQFSQLDAELSTYEKHAERDPRFEMNAMAAFAAFATSDVLISDRIDKWTQVSPNSYAAAMASAVCLTETAFRWRGTNAIDDTPSANIQAMNDNLGQAGHQLSRALALNPNLALAYAMRIKAARLGGTPEDVERAKNEALARVPDSFSVREQIMYALEPRWGGSREEMKKFSEASQAYAGKNPAMTFLKAFIPMDIAVDAEDAGQPEQAISYYTQAVKEGGEYWTTYRRRAGAYARMQRWDQALADAKRANQLFPDNSEVLQLLATAAAQTGDPTASLNWLVLYTKFEVPGSSVAQLVAIDRRALEAQAAATPVAAQ